jgi:hypothetical protein
LKIGYGGRYFAGGFCQLPLNALVELVKGMTWLWFDNIYAIAEKF